MTILHISDTQFGQYHRFDDSKSLASHLIRDLARLADLGVPPIDLVVLSGDIAERGLRSEYAQARSFVDAICGHAGLGYDRIVVVPGNHDVNWAASQAYFAECEVRRKGAATAVREEVAALPGVRERALWSGGVH